MRLKEVPDKYKARAIKLYKTGMGIDAVANELNLRRQRDDIWCYLWRKGIPQKMIRGKG